MLRRVHSGCLSVVFRRASRRLTAASGFACEGEWRCLGSRLLRGSVRALLFDERRVNHDERLLPGSVTFSRGREANFLVVCVALFEEVRPKQCTRRSSSKKLVHTALILDGFMLSAVFLAVVATAA